MFVLALVFCLHSGPASCKTVYPDLQPTSLMGCLVSGQQVAARMLAADPELQGYMLRRARCEPADKPREQGA